MPPTMFATASAPSAVLLGLALAGGPLLEASREDRKAAAEKVAGTSALFPDGVTHDFGTVTRGPEVRHAFRIRNTTGAPLTVVSLRYG